MSERQIHGFDYEKSIIKRFDLVKSVGYTDKFDAVSKIGVPYQIKCIKYGSSIDLGDLFRNSNVSCDFVLVVGFWKNDKKNIIKECFFEIDYKKWEKLFISDKFEEMKTWIKSVSNDKSYDIQWKHECAKYKEMWDCSNNVIKLRFKRDHKTQKRIQCSIPYKIWNSIFGEIFKECHQNII